MAIDKEIIQQVLDEKVRPSLLSHGGDISLQEITDDGYIKVRLTGACATCPGAQQTLAEVVEAALRDACPSLQGVIPIYEVGEELLQEALKFLRRRPVS
ncbi:NifU family protein [Sporolituus thermophilus]|uniref:Fe-S cluster biogenesis protein NfuA, 4Fe-4S-binding domain n=1 Tax=Sporolituus thermophilus DSM 23256 TaxID=1123285 RepID=A0A1G7M9F5_9FIRM|nr:NifU family protein [Sporolituus thermophilus]SDF58382.1 Fe-S cluster biogenesis protein NfuA, 4Fe-4S-binding domain [Sporolituus thermophilus DSM 23256]